MRKKLWFVIFALFTTSCFSQKEYQLHGEIEGKGFFSTWDELPFWLYHNKFGRVTESTDFAGLINLYVVKQFKESSKFSFGGTVSFLNDLDTKFFIDEAYLYYENYNFNITVGAKQKEVLYDGISSTNENLIWSNNTRNIPGIKIATTQPFWITHNKKLGFEGSWEEYYLGENKYVKHTLLHHKRLLFVFEPTILWQIKAGIQHSVQWGGISPDLGAQPSTFKDYLRIITAQKRAENILQADQVNSLGNHLGSYELYVTRKFSYFSMQFLYNSIFEDGSGLRLQNFPDGRYGLYFKFTEEDKLVKSVIYEYINLRNQSYLTKLGADDYFGHQAIYKTGYTYNYMVLGVPFITYDKERMEIVNNKLVIHHVGLTGQFSYLDYVYSYKFMASYSHNEGTYSRPQLPNGDNQQFLDLFLNLNITNLPVNVGIDIAARIDSHYDPNYGMGLHISKTF